MYSTLHKVETKRSAIASATLIATPALIEVLRSRRGPKGDALEIARAAGVMGVKKTPELIPFCHPIPIDQVIIDYDLKEAQVDIRVTVHSIGKTGVEMEALTGAQITAVTLFDMLKPLDPAMTITDVKVLEKRGGKSDFKETLPNNFKAAVMVTSDGTAAGKREDRSGKIIVERLRAFGVEVIDYKILPDEREVILAALQDYFEKRFNLVMTTGGTGLGPRDVTTEATKSFIEKEIPGIAEAARSFGQRRTPYAMLSRGVAGLKGDMIVVNLPGSSRGTAESLDAIFPGILHGYKMMQGGGH